jgi:hypothetical protein
MARVQFPVFHSFCFLMYYLRPYVLKVLHSVHSVLLLLVLYSVLLMYYYSALFIVCVTLASGIGPIAVGNIYIYIYVTL